VLLFTLVRNRVSLCSGVVLLFTLTRSKVSLWTHSSILFFYTPAPRRGRRVHCFTSVRPSVRPRYFSSHFSQ
jgi:hypothetical protein